MPKPRGHNSGPATRDAALDAARRLFTERGYDGTSMRDIAGAVGLTGPALYYHFPSKDSLLAALSQVRRDEIDALVQWTRDQEPGPELLRAVGLRWLAGATTQRLEGMRLATAVRPALQRAVTAPASVPLGFELLVDLLVRPADPVDRLRVRLVLDAFGAAAGVAGPDDDLGTIVAAARTMVLGLTAEHRPTTDDGVRETGRSGTRST